MSSAGKSGGERFRPSDYMRGRHPDLFSDSEAVEAPVFEREVVEHHLHTLTERQQEAAFETFCRLLAEHEITPNLRPQTGPTGGGDGKVDSETYPVDDSVAQRWYVADVRGGQERWAFAFSAKKAWRPKIRADVKSAVGTGRGYARVIFISNQAISSRARLTAEEELGREFGVPVTIHDRAWIMEKVFGNRRFDLLGSLGMVVPAERRERTGPQDLERSRELEALEAQIADPGRYEGTPYALAEDCLSAALLARGLGHPRDQVEGKFLRAERNAQRLNHPHQQLRIAYARAWTTYFWFDDPEALARLYAIVEAHAAEVGEIDAWDLVSNLFFVLQPAVARGDVSPEVGDLEARRARLGQALDAIAADPDRVTSALRARAARLMLAVGEAFYRREPERLDALWTELQSVVAEADRHADYPFQTLFGTLQAVGQFALDSEAFDAMFETAVDVLARRGSETAAGRAHAERARQKLKGKRFYDAIRLYGRAITRLRKEEATEDLVPALGGLSVAYEAVGLPWAARTAILAATERSLTSYLRKGQIVRPALAALRRLNHLELRLGRPAQALCGMQVEAALRNNITLSDEALELVSAEVTDQDRLLSGLMLRLPLEDLRRLTRFPGFLDAAALDYAWTALVFALGDIAGLKREAGFPDDEPLASIEELFSQWFEATSQALLQKAPFTGFDGSATLRSRVLGVRLSFTVPNTVEDLAFAESILGVLEAFLATSLNTGILPYRDTFDVVFTPDPEHDGAPSFAVRRNGGAAWGEIRYAPAFVTEPPRVGARANAAFLMVGEVITAVSVAHDVQSWLAAIAEEEEAYSRAMSLFDVGRMSGAIFGDGLATSLADLIDADADEVPLQRTRAWTPAMAAEPAPAPSGSPAEGPPPAEMLDAENGSHPERRISSLIDLPVWDAAGWCGCGQMWSEDEDDAPCLLLLFKDPAAGRQIFEGLRARLGPVDREGELRIAILRGLHVSNPSAYGVTIGQNLDLLDRLEPPATNRQMLVVTRRQVMMPSDPRNLDEFLRRMRRTGACFLMPAGYVEGREPDVIFDVPIATSHLRVRNAWEIGVNDLDAELLDPEDPPHVPQDVANPPALRALAWIEEIRAGRGPARVVRGRA